MLFFKYVIFPESCEMSVAMLAVGFELSDARSDVFGEKQLTGMDDLSAGVNF